MSNPLPEPERKMAPVQGWPQGIPWSLHLEAYAAYSKKWAPQPALIDLEGRNCRGGFSTGELDEFIPGWREKASEIKALREQLAHAAAEVSAARDCRTCWHHRVEDRHIQTMGHVLCVDQLCTNADRYEALPPVRLWRKK